MLRTLHQFVEDLASVLFSTCEIQIHFVYLPEMGLNTKLAEPGSLYLMTNTNTTPPNPQAEKKHFSGKCFNHFIWQGDNSSTPTFSKDVLINMLTLNQSS